MSFVILLNISVEYFRRIIVPNTEQIQNIIMYYEHFSGVFFHTNVCVSMLACWHQQFGNIIIMPVKFISTHRHLLLHAVVETCRCLKTMHYNKCKD